MMDRAALLAQGKVLALIAALLQRAGVVSAEEFGNLLGIFAVTASEDDAEQGDILAVWAAIVKDSAAQPR
jgi:hypothetical protein